MAYPEPLKWVDGRLKILDQTALPHCVKVDECTDYREVVDAINTMKVRGAPAIGAVCAYGVVLGAMEITAEDKTTFLLELGKVILALRSTRPTAVNLFWALERMESLANSYDGSVVLLKDKLLDEANAIAREDVEANKALGRHGSQLLKDGDTVLTHCNAGALATVGYGTALGIVRAAKESGKRIQVFADETRPFLQGARLTCFELLEDGFDVTLIVDSAAGYCMKKGMIDAVIVGADRVVANGDVANKIGTYQLAVLAAESGIPFYVACPVSTIDVSLPKGDDIIVEERLASEVTGFGNTCVAPEGVKVFNPAFDITPNKLVTAIITEVGVACPPFRQSLQRIIHAVNKS